MKKNVKKEWRLVREDKQEKPVRWWEIAVLTAVVSVLGLLTGKPGKENKALYKEELKQPAWAPPAWLFGPAWTFNNIFILRALLKLLRTKENIPQKKQLLILQTFIWLVFVSFGYVYFRKRSTVLAGIWTVADAGLAISSFLIARKMDKKLANNYLPLMAWTSFASTLAIPQALMNRDELLNTPALLN